MMTVVSQWNRWKTVAKTQEYYVATEESHFNSFCDVAYLKCNSCHTA